MTTASSEVRPATATLEAAAAARSVQITIRARLLRDVAALWPALDPKRLDETFPGWIRAMTLLVGSYHGQSSAAAATSYRLARERATKSPAPRSLIKLARPPATEWTDKAFGYSGPALLERDTARPGTALSTTLGTASRIALDGGRTTTVNTLIADPVALGWYRLTDGDPCAFCALLASRGTVYKAASFDASDALFTGPGEFKVHDMCGCSVVPVFSAKAPLPDVTLQARTVYEQRGPGDALAAFRKAWKDRHNILADPPSAPPR